MNETEKVSTASPQGAIEATLPFTVAASKDFKSTTKVPKGAHRRTCAHAVDRILGHYGDKRQYAQAMATLLPQERQFVDAVVGEYVAWAAARAAQPAAGAQS